MNIQLGMSLVKEVARLRRAVELAIENVIKTFLDELGPQPTLPEYWLAIGRLDAARHSAATAIALCDALAAFRFQTRGIQSFGPETPIRARALQELFTLGAEFMSRVTDLRRAIKSN